MIVVSGSARTGTSMMMQTLLILGYKTPAKKFIKEHEDIIDYNPNGFYELYEEVFNGVNHDKYSGQAVKIFPGQLLLTDKKFISKLIVCTRDKSETISSYKPIHKILNNQYSPEYIYDVSYDILNQYCYNINNIFINFDDMINSPTETILGICDFLEIKPSKRSIDKSIKNIDYATINSSRDRSSIKCFRSLPRI
jgi:hypothetical protein